MVFSSIGACLPANHFSQGPFQIPVPQSVDERVQHEGHYCVRQNSCGVLLRLVQGQRVEIHSNDGATEEGNHIQVGGTGGESFPPSFCGWDSQDSTGDMDI